MPYIVLVLRNDFQVTIAFVIIPVDTRVQDGNLDRLVPSSSYSGFWQQNLLELVDIHRVRLIIIAQA
ncbi:hypothetical protein FoTM2_017191 [Fusarium oxysporum f. sp. vasinfectum]|uniref:Uncharacterized protein n=1 Tax=Fusarium oxysporum f. sp. vasinfectum 25433 TaxID=1089449 RepID=X0KVZ0_FUSOX|nr:hypothetical protein FOTG_18684 [Fusarium oxysporum f. sp. vasinfectum 25433]KAK2922949.1 hypothetical protein FoTM2_017191 [Fusarium oxysporum f. sp. vasinfectum]